MSNLKTVALTVLQLLAFNAISVVSQFAAHTQTDNVMKTLSRAIHFVHLAHLSISLRLYSRPIISYMISFVVRQ